MPVQNASAAKAAFDQILGKVNTTSQKDIMSQLAKVQVGSISLNSILANNPQLPINNGTARDFYRPAGVFYDFILTFYETTFYESNGLFSKMKIREVNTVAFLPTAGILRDTEGV